MTAPKVMLSPLGGIVYCLICCGAGFPSQIEPKLRKRRSTRIGNRLVGHVMPKNQNSGERQKILKLADKTSNLGAIAASPSPDWSVKRRLDYIGWARQVEAGLKGVSPWLEDQFERAAAEAERSTMGR